MKRIVLDTNVLISALLFGGRLESLIEKWKAGALVPVFSRATFAEFRKVLTYPRFGLTEQEINVIIEDEILPYSDVVETGEEISGICRDSGDDIFLSCALAARAEAIVSGDQDLLDLGSFRDIPILSVNTFLHHLS